MNVQTEHLENRVARLTVEIDSERLEKAKRTAARKIAKQVNIRGFRKGKVPYNVLVQKGLEPQILESAIDVLGQEIYREMLEESELEPYGPGALESVEVDPLPKFIYTVPLQPTVELNDYKSIRHEYEAPEVTDEQVEAAMKEIQQREALVEESEGPVEAGNSVTVDIHSEFADDAPDTDDADDADATADDEEDTADFQQPAKGSVFVHEHDATMRLDPENEPIIPGFIEGLVGANVGEDVEFELTVPEDDPEYGDVGGREVKFQVTVNKIERVTLPELNDDLAARLSEDDDEPLTLLQLRMRVREQLQKQLESNAKGQYVNEMFEDLIEEADVEYPLAMVEEQIDAMLKDIGSRLQQQGMDLNTYMQVTGQTEKELREAYREQAAEIVERSLVMREIVRENGLEVTDAKIDARIDEMMQQFGTQAEQLRPMFDNPQMRASMVEDLLRNTVTEFVFQMGQGEDIEDFMVQQAAKDAELEAEKAQAKETAVDAAAIETVGEDVSAEDSEEVEDAEFEEIDTEQPQEVEGEAEETDKTG